MREKQWYTFGVVLLFLAMFSFSETRVAGRDADTWRGAFYKDTTDEIIKPITGRTCFDEHQTLLFELYGLPTKKHSPSLWGNAGICLLLIPYSVKGGRKTEYSHF